MLHTLLMLAALILCSCTLGVVAGFGVFVWMGLREELRWKREHAERRRLDEAPRAEAIQMARMRRTVGL